MWFTKRPGQQTLLSEENPDPRLDEAAVLILGEGATPDWVRLPPALGGHQVKVVGSIEAPCPRCRDDRPVLHLKLDAKHEGRDLCVSECNNDGCGFVWYGGTK